MWMGRVHKMHCTPLAKLTNFYSVNIGYRMVNVVLEYYLHSCWLF